jgi:thermitase
MRKYKIGLVISVLFIFFSSSNFDHPRFRKQKRSPVRASRFEAHIINNGQPYRMKEQRYAPDQILVKFKPRLSTLAIETTVNAYQARKIKRIPALDIYLLKIPEYLTVEEMLHVLSINPDVEYACPNYRIYIAAVPKPNDNLFNWQYALFNEGQQIGSPGPTGKSRADIKALEAWEETEGDEGVVVAVIDTGIDFDHPDLEGKITSNGYDFVNKDNEPIDDHGHGTYVAGLIAAKTNNREGIAGVNWNSTIMPLKAIEADGSGYVDDLVDAIIYAADNGASVISMSLGFALGPGESAPDLEDAMQYAYQKNVVCVASAGNEGDAVLYPAAYDDYCLAVAATDYDDSRPSWSNFGPEVDVAAPGLRVVSLVPTWLPELIWKDFTLPPYGFGDGTSASAAIVSGFVSLIRSLKPWMSVDQIMDVVRFSADDVNTADYPGKDEFIGYGRINMEKALLPIKINGSK